MVAFLNKSEGCEDFHQIIDFLNLSHITVILYRKSYYLYLLIHSFGKLASASTSKNEEMEITATIDGRVKTITEASIRRHLKLEDSDGIPTLSNAEIFEQLALMGYASDFDKLTFQKGQFSPQWRFLIHTILHCLSPKKTAWEQFSSNIATAIICLATNRTFNFSKMIFEDEGTSWIQEDAETQRRTSADTEILLEQEEPTELVEDPGSGEKGEKEISTVEVLVSTASEFLNVKKTKKQLEQERLRHEEAIRLQEQINEEERQRIARDAEIAK
ncbi:hypothetical protein Tco_1264144 [Tanacetum coccineum]